MPSSPVHFAAAVVATFSTLALSTLALSTLALSTLAGCHADSPDGRPETTCTKACSARASAHCSHDECVHGCRFVLDRLLEHEGDAVIQCVARASGKCDDTLFAECAAKVGEHADGGPPGPKPPEDE